MGLGATSPASLKAEALQRGTAKLMKSPHDSQESPTGPAPHSWWEKSVRWVGAFFSRVFGNHPVTKVFAAPKNGKMGASFIDTTQRRGLKQDMERTAQATKDEGEHIVALTDVWGQMAEEDRTEEERIRSEDESERMRATTADAPHIPTKKELEGRHGADMSSFWGTLESQDRAIEKSVSSEKLGEYERLTSVQNELVSKAAKQIQQNALHTERKDPLHHNDNAFLSKTIHDTWEGLEKKDKATEKRIHDSPDLQMLQLDHSWHSLK